MASLPFTPPSPLTLTTPKQPKTKPHSTPYPHFPRPVSRQQSLTSLICSYKVVIEHDGETTELEVDPDESILSKALDSGLDIPHDCKLGVCMTCPAKLIKGSVDQSEGMLSDDVIERGYALMCVAYPLSDCTVQVIPEEELLSLQLATAND
ncbi:ferredoxin C 1, chloroplastic [Silene latifolia]|uniref:ferredoxin C 1, chloroplastic n=1 Tax=Silene latifolia TaxID=37657 RepID=UPI003D78A78B